MVITPHTQACPQQGSDPYNGGSPTYIVGILAPRAGSLPLSYILEFGGGGDEERSRQMPIYRTLENNRSARHFHQSLKKCADAENQIVIRTLSETAQ
jgi:hypothetical protein